MLFCLILADPKVTIKRELKLQLSMYLNVLHKATHIMQPLLVKYSNRAVRY